MYLTFPKTYSYLGGFYFGSIDYYHMLALIGCTKNKSVHDLDESHATKCERNND